MKNLFTAFVTILFSTFMFAQAPRGISYQAIALNTGGIPVVNSKVGVKISILNNSGTGPVIYSETHTKPTNALGLFNLNIGQGNPTKGTFSAIDWATNSVFLKVELDPDGGTNYTTIDTNQMVWVPFAQYAKNVGNISAGNDLVTVEPDSNGIGIMTYSHGYAFFNNRWYPIELEGSGKKIISTRNNIGIMTYSHGYAFSNNQWYPIELKGSPQNMIGNGGIIGILTYSYGYAFNKNQWYRVELKGSPQNMIIKSGKILIYTYSHAYTFDMTTNQWYAQELSGSTKDYAH